MADGPAVIPPSDEDDPDRRGAGAWPWSRDVLIGLAIALVLLVLLAIAVGDVIPGGGGGVVTGPTPNPTYSSAPPTSPLPTVTPSGGTSPTATGTGTGSGTGGGGGGTSGGGGGGTSGGGSGTHTSTPPPSNTLPPTPTPTPTPTRPIPTVGPDHCTAYYGDLTGGPGCDTRQLGAASVIGSGLHANVATVFDDPARAASSDIVALAPQFGSFGTPGLAGAIEPIYVTDLRGASTGWSLTASLAVPLETTDGVQATITPTCDAISGASAPGVAAGPASQLLSGTVTLCQKNDELSSQYSTSGFYRVDGSINVDAWRGTTIPTGSLVLTLNLA